MSKIVEKFNYLRESGEGLLHRLYFTRSLFANPKTRPAFLADQTLQKVLRALLAKFPDFPEIDKIQGYEMLTGRAKNYSDELEQHYETFVDCVDWRDAALTLLTEIGSSTSTLTLSENPVLAEQWLDLMVLYVKVYVLAGYIPDRRTILAVYYKMFYHIRSSNEPSYPKTSKWMVDTDAPFRKIQDEFRAINDAMGKALMPLMMPYMKSRSISVLRKEGALNLILKPEEMTRPIQDQTRLDLILASKTYQWLVYGFLCTPGTLALPGAIDFVKFVLSEGFLTPVFRDVTIALYPEYSSLFANYKSKTLNLQKQKKPLKEGATASVMEGGRRHLERRIYIRQELEAMWHLFRDKPALLGPKIMVLYAAMSLAKEELFWYFRHTDNSPPEKLKKSYKAEEFKDKRISSLIFLLDNLANLVLENKKIIAGYYLEFMAGADLQALTALLDSNFISLAGPALSNLALSIVQDLQKVTVESYNAGRYAPNFRNFRENWLRIEVLMSSPASSVPLSRYKAFTHRFHLAYLHSRNVDVIDELLEEYAGCRALWYHKDSIFVQPQTSLFDTLIMDGPDQPLHAMTFMRLLAVAPLNATAYWPEERELIGTEAVTIARDALTKVATRVVNILHIMATHFIQNDYQMADANAAVPLLRKRKDWKPPKDYVPPAEPGSESVFKNRTSAAMETLRLYERNAYQLLTSLQELVEITIFDHVFSPREFLREKLASNLKLFLRKAVLTPAPDNVIQRPSILEMHIRVYTSVMCLVENYVDLDVNELLREVLLFEVYARPIGRIGRADWFPEGDIDFGEAMIGTLGTWYAEFLAKRVPTGATFSPLRMGFVPRPGNLFRAEEYADYVELQALVRIVGVYGVKLLEREILRFVLSNIAGMKEVLNMNAVVLEELNGCYHKETRCNDALRKLRDVDNFINRAIAIGAALEFRKLLHSATRQVTQEQAPYIFSAINTMFEQYARNTFLFPDLIPADIMANDVGIDVETADQPLKVMLKKAAPEADKRLWDLLATMFAASFATSAAWREASFKPLLEGHVNNVHCLASAINDLIVAFGVVTGEEDIASQLYKYIEISSMILLRLARAKSDKHGPTDYPSVVIFLDQFVDASPLITKDVLERCLPYALLRNMYKQLYEEKLVPGTKVSTEVPQSEM